MYHVHACTSKISFVQRSQGTCAFKIMCQGLSYEASFKVMSLCATQDSQSHRPYVKAALSELENFRNKGELNSSENLAAK